MKTKKLLQIAMLAISLPNLCHAQVWTAVTGGQVTPTNIGVGEPITFTPDSRLNILSGYTVTGGTPIGPIGSIQTPTPCTLVGQSALSIHWSNLDNLGAMQQYGVGTLCSNTLISPNIFELWSFTPTGSISNQTLIKNPFMGVNANGKTFIGTNAAIGNNALTVGGSSYFADNVQILKKCRISTSTTLTSTDWTTSSFPYSFSVDNGDARFLGKVRIGALQSTDPNNAYALSVNGVIEAQKVVVQTSNWADDVFGKEYTLAPLAQVENYINTNKHLPNMPSTAQVVSQGQDLAEMQRLQQAKIEELTLYIIALQKDIEAMKAKK